MLLDSYMDTQNQSNPITETTTGQIVSEILAPSNQVQNEQTQSKSNIPKIEVETPGDVLPAQTPSPSGEILDASGNKFIPGLHHANPDGTPKTNFKGNFYATGRPKKTPTIDRPPQQVTNALGFSGPKPGTDEFPSFASDGDPRQTPGESPNSSPVPSGPDKYDALAETYLQLGYGPMIMLFSDEVRTEKGEHAALKDALANWLRQSQADDLPPGLAFAFVAAGVYMPKMTRPKVKERIAVIWLKIKGFFSKDKV